jgi:CHAD domain-containing protein
LSSQPIAFAAGSLARGRQALAAVARVYRGRRDPVQRVRETFLDTLDGRIGAAGGTLSAIEEKVGFVLCRRTGDGSTRHRLLVSSIPPFVGDLPASPLRDDLEDLAGERRLLPLLRVDVRRTVLRIEDERDKTVARVVLEHGTATFDAKTRVRRVPPTLEVTALRGYEAVGARIARFLADDERLHPLPAARLERVLALDRRARSGRRPKASIAIDPAATASVALARVLRRLLDTMRRKEDGVRRDLDSEFLHDFRVAVRRTRSALGQVKHVLPPADLAHFRGEFDWLGGATNLLRDLDVHLLAMAEHREALPADGRRGLVALEDLLRRRRDEEWRHFVAVLDGERYAALVRDWERFLDATATAVPRPRADTRNAGLPIREVAAARIQRAHRRVIEHGRAIDDASPGDELHRLRIDCKKLRYLLELFASAFEPDVVARLVKALKRLQDNLGALNDLEVQRRALTDLAAELEARGRLADLDRHAVAALLDALGQRRLAERERFARCFAEFDDPGVEARLARALREPRAEAS